MLKEHTLLMTVALPRGATMQHALDKLGLSAEEIDQEYGLVSLDPSRGLYVLLVAESAAARIRDHGQSGEYSGPFANPKIEPFGPV
ncbi:hypothetical protein F7Q99_21140 [Streptomyces kaniharaensis]|uniref:Uncharacterized protein n=1 Tax=Streptomyces kaniharaensis TaxID=212423 RepID=A0A6N7KVR9_9ACTN|nr:hypothetical protein [Streptomyces kaniharaensis]MQS14699.1 hypothetical protein [Streptomyces kaniharaensis]